MTQRARKMPVESVANSKSTDARNANTLTRISLELTRTFELDEVNRGTDPYNSLEGAGPTQAWNRQRPRR
ncbi:MAG: hypothetical protein AB7G51_13990 [Steroidobacteraceae bacterium]